MHQKMSSASRSICCACLFISMFFDSGFNHWARRELVTFAHRAKNTDWTVQFLNDYVEYSSTFRPMKKKDFFGLYGSELQHYYQTKKNLTQNDHYHTSDSTNALMANIIKTRRHNNIVTKYSQLDNSNCNDCFDLKQPAKVEVKDWPKFDDIIKLTNKYYDWKNDRWRKYRKKDVTGRKRKNKSNNEKGFENDRQHRGNNTRKKYIKQLQKDILYDAYIKDKETANTPNSRVISVTPVAFASQRYKNMRALNLKRLSDNDGRKILRKIEKSPSRKDIKSMKNFHFSRVRMEGKEKSQKIVVAVSAKLPAANKNKTRSENRLQSLKRRKINKLGKKQE